MFGVEAFDGGGEEETGLGRVEYPDRVCLDRLRLLLRGFLGLASDRPERDRGDRQ